MHEPNNYMKNQLRVGVPYPEYIFKKKRISQVAEGTKYVIQQTAPRLICLPIHLSISTDRQTERQADKHTLRNLGI